MRRSLWVVLALLLRAKPENLYSLSCVVALLNGLSHFPQSNRLQGMRETQEA